MPVITQARNIVSATYQNDVYFVFENLTDGAVKLTKTTRTQLDTIVAGGNQQQLITNATTILPKSGYGNGQIDSMDLFADPVTGVVRLTIAKGTPNAQNKFDIYMGRINSGNWVACANSPFGIDGIMKELVHVNGTSKEANVITSEQGTIYLEGH